MVLFIERVRLVGAKVELPVPVIIELVMLPLIVEDRLGWTGPPVPVDMEEVMLPLIVDERLGFTGPPVLEIVEELVELIGTAVVTIEVTVLVLRDPGPADAVAVVVNVVGVVI